MANKFPLILNTSANQIQEIASGDNLDLTGCKIVGLQGINSAGIVTFTKAHVGAGTTWGEDLVVTGNARVTGILTVGTNSVVINGNDVNITGVTTASNFKTGTSNLHNVGLEIAGINVLGADTPIGTGATIYNSGAAVFTGIVTATNYVGTINTPAQPNITSVGTLSSLDVSGNVSIGGTLTYEDVTNIDSVGLITARNGLRVTGGTSIFTGNTTFNGTNTFAGNSVVSGNYLDIQDGKKLRLGTDGDLSFYHQGGANFIKNSSSQIIHIQTDASIRFNSTTGSHNILIGEANGPVKLFFNNSNKIETTNTGAVVTGILTATGNVDIAHGTGQAHYQITQTSGNTVKFGLVSGSDVEISGSSNNNIVIKRAGATRLTATSSGVNFGGTDYGFGTTPGGNPAAKNVFLAIGDSDTGIVQDGDGQLELWANNTEVANISAIDGYTSTKPITTTGYITASGGAGAITVSANSDIRLANGTWSGDTAKIQHHDNKIYVQGGNDGIRLRNITGSRQLKMDNDGHFGPDNGQTYNLGSSGHPWAKLFATSATFYDNGAASPIVDIRSDDGSPWHLNIANDSYSNDVSHGLNFHLDSSGVGYIRNIGASSYNDLKIGVNGGTAGGTVDTLIVDQTGVVVDGNSGVSAKRLTLSDNGASGPILSVRTDDNSPWALQVGNDTYNAGCGQQWYQDNTGDFYQRLKYTNAGFKTWYFQVTDGNTTNNAIKIDSNRSVQLFYQGASRLYTADPSSTTIGVVIENGGLEVKHTADWQLRCYGTDSWAGIQFKDVNNADHLWYNGANSTFTIGGGGSNVAGKKLHIDGGTSIGSVADTWTPPANGLTVQGVINVGSGAVDNEVSAFTNWDAGNQSFTHRGSRTLHSNGTGWDGALSNDGSDPMIVCSVADRAGNSDIGDSLGLLLHSESDDNDDYSPLIAFSSKSNSGSYNSIYAAIAGRRTGQGADHNWNAGQLNFYTAGKGSNRAPDQYMDNTPDFFIDRYGYTGTPRMPYFWVSKNQSAWSISANSEFVWDTIQYNIGGHYNNSNGRFYAPRNGYYHFDFNTIFTNNGGSILSGWVSIRINGNRIQGGDMHFTQTNASHWDGTCWSGVLYLTAGQYVSCWAGSAATFHGANWSRFSGHMLSNESW